jgi:hypothetical protein
MRLDLERMDKDSHLHMYRMFCSSWIHNSGGIYKMPVTGDRFVLDEILACGKISPDEALAIENEVRERIPELHEYIASVEERCKCQDIRH